ncbi:MAG: translation elongation factor-like protein [Candidatus Altiarchaeales archaeon ex4484_43]|nr:MAG: translation elongation factor-like protein [Candidatus Altiarchaeales archaeon ex4484_43]
MVEKQKVGEVFTYFAKPGVAGIKITDGSLEIGDKILIRGHTTNFEQVIESMQIEHGPIQRAEAGQSIGIKVRERVRPHDGVYKI